MNSLEIAAAILAYLFLAALCVAAVMGGSSKPSPQQPAKPAKPARSETRQKDDVLTLYIAGPMSGLPDFNYPAFYAAEARLRAAGYRTLNPARNPKQSSWEDYMMVGLRMMLKGHAVALLPDWQKSPGATIERQLAHDIGMETDTLEYWLDRAQVTGTVRTEVAQ